MFTCNNKSIMSEEPKITSVEKTIAKVKDPRRVEAGKRLGMISKQVKERKARERSEAEAKASEVEKNEWFPNASIGSPVVGIGFVGLVGLALYFAYVKKYKTVETVTASESTSESTSKVASAKDNPMPKRVYKELDTLD